MNLFTIKSKSLFLCLLLTTPFVLNANTSKECHAHFVAMVSPINDKPCKADTLQSGIWKSGNNCMADKEIVSPCNIGTDASVWYIIPIQESGKFFTVEFTNMSMSGNYVVDFFSGSNCTNLNLLPQSLEDPKCSRAQFSLNLNCFNKGENVYIRVGSDANTCGNYSLRFIEDNFICNAHVNCNDLTPIDVPVNSQVCQTGCNFGICGNHHCTPNGNATYYAFRADPKTTNAIVVSINGANFTPIISIANECFSPFVTCKYSAISDPIPVPSDGIIYVRVEADGKNFDKDFDVCVIAFSNGYYDCYTSTMVFTRPEHPEKNPNGPMYPGETINFCYEVYFDVSSAGTVPPEGNNCQWLQGIVPVINEAWDLEKLPLSTQPAPAAANWLADSIVHYNFNSPKYSLKTFDDGRLGLEWGVAGLKAGDPMPAGWYWASPGSGDDCTDGSNPDTAWGLPASCRSLQILNICFQLKIKDFDEMSDCETSTAQLTMFVFADGELGCWTNISCGLSVPLNIKFEIDCSKIPDTTTSTNYMNSHKIKIAPNPGNENFKIILDEKGDEVYFNVWNTVGNIMKEGTINTGETDIDTSNWSVGIYTIHLKNKNGQQYITKWVKM